MCFHTFAFSTTSWNICRWIHYSCQKRDTRETRCKTLLPAKNRLHRKKAQKHPWQLEALSAARTSWFRGSLGGLIRNFFPAHRKCKISFHMQWGRKKARISQFAASTYSSHFTLKVFPMCKSILQITIWPTSRSKGANHKFLGAWDNEGKKSEEELLQKLFPHGKILTYISLMRKICNI